MKHEPKPNSIFTDAEHLNVVTQCPLNDQIWKIAMVEIKDPFDRQIS